MRQAKPRQLDAAGLFDYAVKRLASRAYSSGDLKQKLTARAAQPQDVDAAILRLKDNGYLNDRQFAENFASARLQNEQFGKQRVLHDLRQRRVSGALATTTVERVYGEVDEAALVEDYIRRRYRSAEREKLFQDEKDLASAYRRLLRAGFATGNILRALKKFAHNPDLLDGFEPPEEFEESE